MTTPTPTVVKTITETETCSSLVASEAHRYAILDGVQIPAVTRSQ